MAKETKEEKFKKEIRSLNITNFFNLPKENSVIVLFTRRAYGKEVNGWAKYPNKQFTIYTTIEEVRNFMIDFGQIAY